MSLRSPLPFAVATALALVACAAGEAPLGGSTGPGGSAGSGGAGGTDGAGGLFGGGGPGGGGPDCSEAAKLIYVLSAEKGLYSFSPPDLAFQKLGTVDCPAPEGASPFSMAVDRKGVAWVLFDDGSLYHLDTATAACTPTSFVTDLAAFSTFGMGFVADAPGSSKETLYVASINGASLGTIDTSSLALSKVGDYDAIFESAELTGTGAAKLHGFFTTSPPIVAEIDPATAEIVSQAPQPSVDIGSAWAFAFWGGDFYLFTSPGTNTRVDRYRPSDGTTVTLKSNIGFHVVGAGVSTCAPTEPPG